MSEETPTTSDLGRWRLLDVEYTAVFTDGLDPDPAVVREIHAFDPYYVPLLVRRVYQAVTGGVVAYGYHVIGRYIPVWAPGDVPRDPVHLSAVPADWPYAAGTVYAQRTWSLPWKKGSWQFRSGFPDIFLPHDTWLAKWMHACHREMYGEAGAIKARILARLRAQADAGEQELERLQAARREMLHEDRRELQDAARNELHWLEHPRQRPADPSLSESVEIHREPMAPSEVTP